jgi:hypothetical protein
MNCDSIRGCFRYMRAHKGRTLGTFAALASTAAVGAVVGAGIRDRQVSTDASRAMADSASTYVDSQTAAVCGEEALGLPVLSGTVPAKTLTDRVEFAGGDPCGANPAKTAAQAFARLPAGEAAVIHDVAATNRTLWFSKWGIPLPGVEIQPLESFPVLPRTWQQYAAIQADAAGLSPLAGPALSVHAQAATLSCALANDTGKPIAVPGGDRTAGTCAEQAGA